MAVYRTICIYYHLPLYAHLLTSTYASMCLNHLKSLFTRRVLTWALVDLRTADLDLPHVTDNGTFACTLKGTERCLEMRLPGVFARGRNGLNHGHGCHGRGNLNNVARVKLTPGTPGADQRARIMSKGGQPTAEETSQKAFREIRI